MHARLEIDVEDIDESNLHEIPEPCRGCVYWESPEDFEKSEKDQSKRDELEVKKREWFEHTLKEFGTCGKIVYHKGIPIAYAQYTPSTFLSSIRNNESKPVGKADEGVVFLSCLYVVDEKMRDKGVGEALLQRIIEDLRRRGFRAIETYATRNDADNPSGPMRFYIKNGFNVKDNTNPEIPLMRFYF